MKGSTVRLLMPRLGLSILAVSAVVLSAAWLIQAEHVRRQLRPMYAEMSRVLEAPVWLTPIAGTIAGALDAAVVVLAAALGLLLIWKKQPDSVSWALASFLVLIGCYVSLWKHDLEPSRPWFQAGFRTFLNPFFVLALGAFMRFSATFPKSIDQSQIVTRHRVITPLGILNRLQRASCDLKRLTMITGLSAVFVTALMLLTPWPRGGGGVFARGLFSLPYRDDYIYVGSWALNIGELFAGFGATVFVLMLLTGVFTGIGNLVVSFNQSSAEGRRRIIWVLEGFLFLGLALSFVFVAAFWGWLAPSRLTGWLALVQAPHSLVSFALLGLIVCLGAAVLYAGSLDPGLVLHRTAIYGVLGGVGVFAFAIIENLAADFAEGVLEMEGRWGSIFTAAVLALLLRRIGRFVEKRVSPLIDRRSTKTQLDKQTL